RALTRGTRQGIPRRPGVDAYPRSHVTDHPPSRQYRRISIRVFPVLGIGRGYRRGHGRGHPNRYVSERVSGAAGRRKAQSASCWWLRIRRDKARQELCWSERHGADIGTWWLWALDAGIACAAHLFTVGEVPTVSSSQV